MTVMHCSISWVNSQTYIHKFKFVSCSKRDVIFIAPSAPPRNVIRTTTSRSITVTWDTINCIERNGIITSYTVEFGPSGNPTMMTGITELTFTANRLTPFTNYTFRGAGVNSAGTGVYSTIITFTTSEESMLKLASQL